MLLHNFSSSVQAVLVLLQSWTQIVTSEGTYTVIPCQNDSNVWNCNYVNYEI